MSVEINDNRESRCEMTFCDQYDETSEFIASLTCKIREPNHGNAKDIYNIRLNQNQCERITDFLIDKMPIDYMIRHVKQLTGEGTVVVKVDKNRIDDHSMLQRLIKGLDDLENEKRRYLIMSSDVEISEISDEELTGLMTIVCCKD